MKKLIIAISSIWLLAVSSAMSMDLRPSIGISGNMAAYSALGIEENYNEAGSAIDETHKVTGAFATEYASVFVELGLTDVISIGLDYVPNTIETPQNISNEDQGNENAVKAHIEDLTTLYAKLDLPLGGTYLKFGISAADVTSIENMSSGNTYGNDSTTGITLGVGYNHEVSNGISIRAEVTASEFDDVKATNGQTNKTDITIQNMIGARGTISLVKSF